MKLINSKMKKLPRILFIKYKMRKFKNSFRLFGEDSGFGQYGYGDDCIIEGAENISVGDNTWFGRGSEIILLKSHFQQNLQSTLILGDHVRATARCRITCAEKIIIEDDVLIAPDVFITDHEHGLDPTVEGGYSPQEIRTDCVKISKGVWLGQRVCVLSGVTIGQHSIIGANSVVTHDIPEYCIAVGCPARIVKRYNIAKKEWENNE